MFSGLYRYLKIFIITLVLLGHHSFQASAMEVPHHHINEVSCIGHDCHDDARLDICEKIQSDKMQVSAEILFLPGESICIYLSRDIEKMPVSRQNPGYLEKVPISHKQLARSHL